MRNMASQSTSLSEAQFAEFYTPFRLDAHTVTEPTDFEISLLISGVRYEYGFSYDGQRIRNS